MDPHGNVYLRFKKIENYVHKPYSTGINQKALKKNPPSLVKFILLHCIFLKNIFIKSKNQSTLQIPEESMFHTIKYSKFN